MRPSLLEHFQCIFVGLSNTPTGREIIIGERRCYPAQLFLADIRDLRSKFRFGPVCLVELRRFAVLFGPTRHPDRSDVGSLGRAVMDVSDRLVRLGRLTV